MFKSPHELRAFFYIQIITSYNFLIFLIEFSFSSFITVCVGRRVPRSLISFSILIVRLIGTRLNFTSGRTL